MGDGTTNGRSTPGQVLSGVKAVSARSSDQSFFLKTDGSVWAAGQNENGQLGDGTLIDRTTPVQVLTGAKDISTALRNNTLFLKTDGTVWATGGNRYGNLGDGTTTQRSTPVQVLSEVKAISAGPSHSLFLKTDGSVWAAGSNSIGEFGNGTAANSYIPIQVMGPVPAVKAISAGANTSAFLKEDGTAWTTGFNLFGQLGDGTTTNRSTPVQVLAGVKAISAGYYHILFLKTDGSVWATGYNNYGQLGDGTYTNRSSPVQVLSGVKAISAGLYHSLFIKTDNTVWATGRNDLGQLGDAISRSTPGQVFDLGSSPGSDWQDEQFGEDAGNPLISGWNEDPDHDGVVNLLERAFNLSPLLADRSILVAESGTAGLPLILSTEQPGGRVISIEYIRRIPSTNPGLTYIPQFSSTLQDGGAGGWTDFAGEETLQYIDTV